MTLPDIVRQMLPMSSSERLPIGLIILDRFSSVFHLLNPSEINVLWRQVIQLFVVSTMIVVINKALDCLLQLPRIVVVLHLDHIVHRPVISFDFNF